MKKEFKYCSSVIALGTLLFFAGCSNSTKTTGDEKKTVTEKVDSLPSKPKDQQRYTDSSGNQWMWNAAMMCWMMNNTGGGSSYYYYPSTGSYTDTKGNSVTPPSSVSSGINNGVKARTEPVTVTKTTTVSSKGSTTSGKSTGRSVFGSSGRSHSIGA